MKTYALVRYGQKDNEISLEGAYFFPVAAQDAAHVHGAKGHWLESDGHALVAARQMLYDKEATWYLCQVEVMPACNWKAARATARLLLQVLGGLARKARPW